MDHLISALKEQYEISEYWEVKLYCGIKLEWDYNERTCVLSMPDYVAIALKDLQPTLPIIPQYAQHRWIESTYGQKIQLVDE